MWTTFFITFNIFILSHCLARTIVNRIQTKQFVYQKLLNQKLGFWISCKNNVLVKFFIEYATKKISTLLENYQLKGLNMQQAKILLVVQLIILFTSCIVCFNLRLSFIFNAALSILMLLLIPRISEIYLKSILNRRSKSFVAALPESMSFIIICLRSGLNVFTAIKRAGLSSSNAVARRELLILYQDIKIVGSSTAITRLVNKFDVEVIKRFGQTLLQSLNYGSELTQRMSDLIELVSKDKIAKLESTAAKISSKMLLPMMLFILPTVFLVILGPMIVKFVKPGVF